MFDTHCHLNFKRFKKNVDEVIFRAREAGVEKIVMPGTDVATSKKAVELAAMHNGLYAAVGIHPHHAAHYIEEGNTPPPDGYSPQGEIFPKKFPPLRGEGPQDRGCLEEIKKNFTHDIREIEHLLNNPKVVAIGEVGMDRHVYKDTKYEAYAVDARFLDTQAALFKGQIDLAIKYKKALICHNREAKEDFLQILREKWDESLRGHTVFHCCESDLMLLDFAKEHTIYIGVDGDVTYDKDKQEFIRQVPLDILVIETDSPFILPEPLLSEKKYPNEPANVKYVAEAISRLKGEKLEKVITVTQENGERLFDLS